MWNLVLNFLSIAKKIEYFINFNYKISFKRSWFLQILSKKLNKKYS